LAKLMVSVPRQRAHAGVQQVVAATMPQNSLPWVSALTSTCGPGWPLSKRCT
jgi:hypothetical protein